MGGNFVEHGTERSVKQRKHHRDLTDAQYRILVMVTVLQRDLGVKYNLAFSEGEYDGSDPRNLFLHGILTGHGGTCVTMPVLYIAIGRRLGYPLKLVHTKEHFFCRWDGNGERFNIEATQRGFEVYDDDHFRHFPKPVSDEEIGTYKYLQSMTRREETAMFVATRARAWMEHLEMARAVNNYRLAHMMVPDQPSHKSGWAIATLVYKHLEVQKEAEWARAVHRIRYPEPEYEDERPAYGLARREFLRILRLRSERRQRKLEPLANNFSFTIHV